MSLLGIEIFGCYICETGVLPLRPGLYMYLRIVYPRMVDRTGEGYLGRRRFLCPIWCLQTVSWLFTSSSLAANTALGQKMAHRKIRAYPKVSRTQQSRVRRFVRRFPMVFILLRYYN